MKTVLLLPLALFASCSSSPPVAAHPEAPPLRLAAPRPEAQPPAPAPTDETATRQWLDQQTGRTQPPTGSRTPTDEAATQQWLEQQTGRPQQPDRPPAPARTPTDEEATRRWLDQTIDYQNKINPPHEPEPLYQIVEKPVYVDRPVYVERGWYGPRYRTTYDYDGCGEPVYYRERYHDSTFPINTLLGAGFGYAIGGHRHHDRGAAIGAGIGLLFDIGNFVR